MGASGFKIMFIFFFLENVYGQKSKRLFKSYRRAQDFVPTDASTILTGRICTYIIL